MIHIFNGQDIRAQIIKRACDGEWVEITRDGDFNNEYHSGEDVYQRGIFGVTCPDCIRYEADKLNIKAAKLMSLAKSIEDRNKLNDH